MSSNPKPTSTTVPLFDTFQQVRNDRAGWTTRQVILLFWLGAYLGLALGFCGAVMKGSLRIVLS